jgi:CRISPR-associated protein Cas2
MAMYLIAYDITDPKRLNRIARYLSKRAVRVQYSVFAAELSRRALDDTVEGLNALINQRTDDVRIYPLPREGDVALLGRQIFPKDILLLNDGYNVLRLNADKLPRVEEI